jgi:hypothetical protein
MWSHNLIPFSSWPMSNSTYKFEKEAWVTGFIGSSPYTIFLLAAIFPTLVLFNSILLSFLIVILPNSYIVKNLTEIKKNGFSFIPRLLFEFFTLVIPSLLAMSCSINTLWKFGLPLMLLTITFTFALHCVSAHYYNIKLFAISARPNLSGLLTRYPTFITQFRSYMMLSTILAILAVDFAVFPREHTKSETFGLSLMDMGVGAVVFSSALVSRQTRLRVQVQSSTLTQKEAENARFNLLRTASSSVIPLIFLGSIRIFAHAFIGYQLHESEYGLHWNFFFTIALVTLVASLLESSFVINSSSFFGRFFNRNGLFLFTIGIEILRYFFLTLSLDTLIMSDVVDFNNLRPIHQKGLGPDNFCKDLSIIKTVQDYILCASRINNKSESGYTSFLHGLLVFILQNREGIIGLPGFLAIYMAGLFIGSWIFQYLSDNSNESLQHVFQSGLDRRLWGALMTGLTALFVSDFKSSRRLVNLSYTAWVIAFNLFILALLLNVNIRTLRPMPILSTAEQLPQPSLLLRKRGSSKSAASLRHGRSASPWRSPSPVMTRRRKSINIPASSPLAADIQPSISSPFSKDILFGGSILLESFNINFLFLFFFANILTGVVNFSLYTLYSSTIQAYSVLTLYIFTVCLVAVIATVFKVNVKVW